LSITPQARKLQEGHLDAERPPAGDDRVDCRRVPAVQEGVGEGAGDEEELHALRAVVGDGVQHRIGGWDPLRGVNQNDSQNAQSAQRVDIIIFSGIFSVQNNPC
jgi:hypothetical protein